MSICILGINAFHADASAVLLKDGEVVGAIAEERLNRVKHFAGFPSMAVRKLLEMGDIGIGDVDHIAIGRDGAANLKQKLGFTVGNLGKIGQLAKQRLQNRAQIRDVHSLVAQACEIDPKDLHAKVHHIEHHLCHAASAFFPSGFDKAAIASVDGFGDFASTMIARGEGNSLKVLDRVYFPHSLGILYTAVCQFIGYDRYGDEGKIMGLAPYGETAYMDLLRDMVHERPDGKFELNLDYFIHHSEGVDYSFDDKGYPTVAPLFSKKLVDKMGPARRRGEEITQRDKDLARSLQARFEEVYFHVLRDLHARTGLKDLCVAGGVTLNSVANGQLFDQTPFEGFYAHPAATDDGTAFGAAYFVHCVTLGKERPKPLHHAYFGNSYTDDEIAAAIERAGAKGAKKLTDDEVFERTATRIAQGDVVGWFQGRMEWGPRALGCRSIVAHPGLPTMKDTLNARIKHREPFRPFAPSILEDRIGECFDHSWPSPFMMLVYPTKPEARENLVAVNHVDNTARLQTVRKEDNPRYYRLIETFAEKTGIPVLLNTSFNENEPVVCTPDEALACYLRTKMDALVMGNWFLAKADD